MADVNCNRTVTYIDIFLNFIVILSKCYKQTSIVFLCLVAYYLHHTRHRYSINCCITLVTFYAHPTKYDSINFPSLQSKLPSAYVNFITIVINSDVKISYDSCKRCKTINSLKRAWSEILRLHVYNITPYSYSCLLYTSRT